MIETNQKFDKCFVNVCVLKLQLDDCNLLESLENFIFLFLTACCIVKS